MPLPTIPAGGAQIIGPASGGKVYNINTLNTSAQTVLQANPQRSNLSFINPGTVAVYVAPLLNAQGQSFTPNLASLGGCFVIQPGGGFLQLTGECQFGWQAFSAQGVNQPFTVMESNL